MSGGRKWWNKEVAQWHIILPSQDLTGQPASMEHGWSKAGSATRGQAHSSISSLLAGFLGSSWYVLTGCCLEHWSRGSLLSPSDWPGLFTQLPEFPEKRLKQVSQSCALIWYTFPLPHLIGQSKPGAAALHAVTICEYGREGT